MSANDQQPDLPPDYYRTNFHTLITFVDDTYGELLSLDERVWLTTIRQCSKAAQFLYIRLLLRKAMAFRQSRLDYPEIDDLPAAAQELAATTLASNIAPEALPIILSCYTRPELEKLLDIKRFKALPRADLVDTLNADDSDQHRAILQEADQWISVAGHEKWLVFSLCFFGNPYQNISEFVLRDLGVVRYETYSIDQASRVFKSRDQIDAHLQCFEIAALFDIVDDRDADALLELATGLPKRYARDINLCRRIDRLRNRIARQLERLNKADAALSLYRLSERPPSRERQVRLLLAQGDVRDAAVLCDRMLALPLNDIELQFAVRTLRKIAIAENRSVKPQPRFQPQLTRLSLHRGAGRVEQVARQFYLRFGECYEVENSLINSVLGLFIWDIMFMPVSGAFFNPFQSAPADFSEPDFIRARQTAFDKRFKEYDAPECFRNRVLSNYRSKQGISNRMVHWEKLTESLLMLSLERIPVADWRVMFQRALADMRENRKGLPDLVLFPESGGYEFIEIKGPGDALQAHQRRWMQFFHTHNIPCRVVHIRWSREKTSG
ncbi:MAG: VRR-NUC domain-containing protein [Granulosicoccus sp.]